MHIDEKALIEFAFDSGLVSKGELSDAQKEAGRTGLDLGEVLVKQGLVTEDDLRRIYAHLLGLPFVDLKKDNLNLDALQTIPEPVSRKHNIIAFKKGMSSVEVAFLFLDDLKNIEYLKSEKGLKILPRFTDRESIKKGLTEYQRLLKKEFGDQIEKEAIKLSKNHGQFGDENSDAVSLEKVAKDKSVCSLVDLILKHALYQDADDIHIEPQDDLLLVRFRIGGALREAFSLPKQLLFPLALRIKFLAGLDLNEQNLPQDGRFKMEINLGTKNESTSFRVSTLPTAYGEKINLRVLHTGALGFNLETLGFHGDQNDIVHNALKHQGVILAAGPAQSGKTTTIYTMLDILNKPSTSIATIENPIEYQLPRVNQTEIKEEKGLNMLLGLRAIIKQDPDVIMVGELKDKEVGSLALNASLSGKIVFLPVAANSAGMAIENLVKIGIEPFLVASTLKVAIGHALVSRLVQDKTTYKLSAETIHELQKIADLEKVLSALKHEKIISKSSSWDTINFFKPLDGVAKNKMFDGFVGIHEVLKITPTVKDLIIKGAYGDEIESQAKREGMLTLVEDALFKAAQGLTTIEEVFRVASVVS